MAEELKILRIDVDGHWLAWDWADFIGALDDTYSTLALIDIMDRLASRTKPNDPNSFAAETRLQTLKKIVISDRPDESRTFFHADDFKLERMLGISKAPPLAVLKIKYGSEGTLDLLGLGRFMEAIQKMYKSYLEGKKIKVDLAEREFEMLLKAVEEAEKRNLPKEEIELMFRNGYRKLGYRLERHADAKRLPKAPAAPEPTPKPA